MTTVQLKSEIRKAIDKVPENVLPELLEYINSIQQPSAKKNVREIIDKIIKEDAALLKRLAE